MSCTRDRWLDVFVTKPDSSFGETYDFDDEFLCTMRSVEVNEDVIDTVEGPSYRAAIVGYATQYLLPTWSANYKEGGAANQGGFGEHPLRKVKTGDIVRVGNAASGHTDYLTVLEVIHVASIWNATGADYRVVGGSATTPTYTAGRASIDAIGAFQTQHATLQQQTTSAGLAVGTLNTHVREPFQSNRTQVFASAHPNSSGLSTYPLATQKNGDYFAPGRDGIAHIVLRVNAMVKCTPPPASFYTNTGTGMMKFSSLHNAMANLHYAKQPITLKRGPAGQKLVSYPHQDPTNTDGSNGSNASPVVKTITDFTPLEIFPYPVYLNKDWAAGSTLYAKLDHGVKSLACIKLTGYSIVNKRQVGIVHQNEHINDDYFILHITEIEGKVVSNNKHANGAFAILHIPVGNSTEGTMEHSQHDPAGIVTHHFDNCDSTIRNLTIKVTDRKGQPAHIGRLHLWFKLLVLHG